MLQGFIPHKTALLRIFELLHKRNEKQRNCVGSSSFEELGAKRFEGRSREATRKDVRGRGTGIRRFKGGWRYNRVQGAMVRVLVQCGTGEQVGSTMMEPGLRYSEVQRGTVRCSEVQ